MKRYLASTILATLLFALPGQAHAVILVDTGEVVPQLGSWALYSGQWLAAEFDLLQDATVTDIQGRLGAASAANSETLTAVIYDDGGDLPDTGSEVFSQVFTVPPGVASAFEFDWYGVSGLNIPLNMGTYWVAFEVRAGNTYTGFGMPFPSQFPLGNEAANAFGGPYFPEDNLNLGVRIFGDIESGPAPVVPEPGSMALFGLGTLAVGMSCRKRNRLG